MAGNLSAKALFEAAKATEDAIKSSQPLDAPLDTLDRELTRVIHGIGKLPEDETSTPTPDSTPDLAENEMDLSDVTKSIVALSGLLEACDLDAEEVLAHLCRDLPQKRYAALLQQLKQEVSDFDFEAATDTLKNLEKTLGISGEPTP